MGCEAGLHTDPGESFPGIRFFVGHPTRRSAQPWFRPAKSGGFPAYGEKANIFRFFAKYHLTNSFVSV